MYELTFALLVYEIGVCFLGGFCIKHTEEWSLILSFSLMHHCILLPDAFFFQPSSVVRQTPVILQYTAVL